MTEPKPMKMWAVCTKHGALKAIGLTERDAQENALAQTPFAVWNQLSHRGYRCIRVTITPDRESEK